MNALNEINTLTPVQHDIKMEIAETFISFGAKSDLISIIMSWGDTINEIDVLNYLKEYRNSSNLPQPQ